MNLPNFRVKTADCVFVIKVQTTNAEILQILTLYLQRDCVKLQLRLVGHILSFQTPPKCQA